MTHINQIKAASIVEKQIFKALMIKFEKFNFHPIRLVQASKSLIGLDLEKPNRKLLDFNSIYLENYNNDITPKIFLNTQISETITIHDLEKAFIKKDKHVIKSCLIELSMVSSALHILEYLIEITLKQSGKSFLAIWSLYRSILFVNKKDVRFFLDFAVDVILSDTFENVSDEVDNFQLNDLIQYSSLSLNFIDLYSHLLEAYESELVRSSKIRPLILDLLGRKLKIEGLDEFINKKNTIKYVDLLKNGRLWLLDFLNQINSQKITINLILFLDSIRCLFKFLDKKDYKFICFQFDKLIKDFDV